MNKVYGRITELLFEGHATGGRAVATAKKLGKWHRSINPEAKPGEEGYMR